jgi:PAS domain-containing protein
VGFAKIIRDATAEKLADERLADSEQQLGESRRQAEAERERLLRELQAASDRMRDIFHRAPAIMCVMSGPDHVIDMANQRYLELAGGRPLAGLAVRAALPELAGQGFIDVLDRVYRSGEAVEGHNVRLLLAGTPDGIAPDGDPHTGLVEHFLDFVCMALRDPDGSVSGVLLHGVDVTERTRANLLAIGQRGALELAVTDAPLGDVLDVLARRGLQRRRGPRIRAAGGGGCTPAPCGGAVAAGRVPVRDRRRPHRPCGGRRVQRRVARRAGGLHGHRGRPAVATVRLHRPFVRPAGRARASYPRAVRGGAGHVHAVLPRAPPARTGGRGGAGAAGQHGIARDRPAP